MGTKKLNALIFGSFAPGITLYSVLWPNYYIHQLVSPSVAYLIARIILAAFLLAYVFVPRVRTPLTRAFMAAAGAIALVFGAVIFFSPTLLGTFTDFIPVGDSLIFIEGGILALLFSIELPTEKTIFMPKSYMYVGTLLAAQPRKLLRAYVSQAKTKKQTAPNLRYAFPFRI